MAANLKDSTEDHLSTFSEAKDNGAGATLTQCVSDCGGPSHMPLLVYKFIKINQVAKLLVIASVVLNNVLASNCLVNIFCIASHSLLYFHSQINTGQQKVSLC